MTQCNGLTWNGTYWIAIGTNSTTNSVMAYSTNGITWFAMTPSLSFTNGLAISSRRVISMTGGGSDGNSNISLINSTISTATLNQTIGYNQTWQAVTRAFNVRYTNTTGRPIMVCISQYTQGSNVGTLYVNEAVVSQMGLNFGGGISVNVSGIVPPGNTYYFDNNFWTRWLELR
jgi:hypothetical protein